MNIATIIQALEQIAPPSYQESYDNAGLLTGMPHWECTGVLCTLDATEAVIDEARQNGCNLVVAHHPIIFSGLKKINGKNYVERTVIAAVKNDIAIYAIHTNLDNLLEGVNGKIADVLGLKNRKVLLEKQNTLLKLIIFAPEKDAETIREAAFKAGAGKIGNYSECSFNLQGTGTFKAEEGADPHIGEIGKRHEEPEYKIEIIFPAYLQHRIVDAMIDAHPYEEVAYDILPLANYFKDLGTGLSGDLPKPLSAEEVLTMVKERFNISVIRHTQLLGKPIKKIAVCGGAGSFLTRQAITAGADLFITSDVKYHEFFDAEDKLVLADIGHWESEQFTTDLLFDVLVSNFPTFAVLKSKVNTNPVQYFA